LGQWQSQWWQITKLSEAFYSVLVQETIFMSMAITSILMLFIDGEVILSDINTLLPDKFLLKIGFTLEIF